MVGGATRTNMRNASAGAAFAAFMLRDARQMAIYVVPLCKLALSVRRFWLGGVLTLTANA